MAFGPLRSSYGNAKEGQRRSAKADGSGRCARPGQRHSGLGRTCPTRGARAGGDRRRAMHPAVLLRVRLDISPGAETVRVQDGRPRCSGAVVRDVSRCFRTDRHAGGLTLPRRARAGNALRRESPLQPAACDQSDDGGENKHADECRSGGTTHRAPRELRWPTAVCAHLVLAQRAEQRCGLHDL